MTYLLILKQMRVQHGLLCHPCNIKLHALDKWTHRDAAVAYLVVPR